jgi:hypothetical protein
MGFNLLLYESTSQNNQKTLFLARRNEIQIKDTAFPSSLRKVMALFWWTSMERKRTSVAKDDVQNEREKKRKRKRAKSGSGLTATPTAEMELTNW